MLSAQHISRICSQTELQLLKTGQQSSISVPAWTLGRLSLCLHQQRNICHPHKPGERLADGLVIGFRAASNTCAKWQSSSAGARLASRTSAEESRLSQTLIQPPKYFTNHQIFSKLSGWTLQPLSAAKALIPPPWGSTADLRQGLPAALSRLI